MPIPGGSVPHFRETGRPMLRLLLVLTAAAAPTAAFAHPGGAGAHGLSDGFLHPLGGLDHVLAMVAVGLLAAQIGGRALWCVPLAFVGMMLVGGAAGLAGLSLPFAEVGIDLSVLMLGLVLAFGWAPPLVGAMGLVGFFALFHGHAHAVEMPADAAALPYAAGFVAATALLHAAGIALGLGIGRAAARPASRLAGCAISLAGAALLAGAV